MGKIILEFDEEERDQALYAIHGIDFLMSLDDIDNKLRALIKYENKEVFSIEEMREFIRDTMDKYNVNLDMLM